ncbi:uncharacterized protein LOC112186204 [Rosa chinensis]|uniref:uncharacterized protein LOC112186204 n=1 Tax=Rosa chinensis TaxID=74649 RepID=UPI000D091482|nr:uncharacterized protein LOC112186204 [Rosa chinensis]
MDKEWVFLDRRTDEYMAALRAFINHSLLVASFEGKIKCPCIECYNCGWRSPKEVEDHLKVDGMCPNYLHSRWKWHGEPLQLSNMGEPPLGAADITAMLHDAFGMHGPSNDDNVQEEDAPPQNLTPDAEKFYRLIEEGKTELYPGCGKSKLDFMLQLYQLKAINCWTDVSFTGLLNMLKVWFPEANLPTNFYQTKKLITDLALPYEKIDVCPKDCMLFWKEHADLDKCKVCGASRYKSKSRSGRTRVAHKVLRYFPLGPRLQRLYMSRHTAQSMVWHSEERPDDEVLRHPADSPAWKHLDTMYPNFASDPRNVRLGLASDGFNPFGMMSLSHSTWPVVMSVYNLPPWLCMKQPYLMLSLLIPGPKGPGKDIDIFLQPLVEELKNLWNQGIPTYDAFKKETFDMHVAVMWTINDFPAYSMLSGWSTKGKLACPQCAFGTKSTRLRHGRKECYLGHRRWLPMAHKYRMFKKPFDGNIELDQPPIPMTGLECLASLHGLKFEYGKGAINMKGLKRKRGKKKKKYCGPWKKKSIFYDLPYWKDLLLRHNLDVMHIEKNVTESVIGTLLGMDGKNKDSLNARLDLQELNCKPKYHPKLVGGRCTYDPMPFTLKVTEKSLFCEILSLALLPDGFSSNLARCVRKAERKLVGLKSHDCHIIMQYLLPLAIRHSLPKEAKVVLLELSSFFRNLCTKVGTKEHFEDLSKRIAITLCHLERLMPPSFFDVMVHLTIHLAEEAKIAGPVQYRWMYPIERYLHTLKKYVRNRNRPEGSIAIGYIIEETLGFCALYLGDEVVSKRNRPGRNADFTGGGTQNGLSVFSGHGRSLGSKQLIHLEHVQWERAHRAVLFGCPEVAEYISQHEKLIIDNRLPRETRKAAQARAHKEFPGWFGTHIQSQIDDGVEIHEDLQALARGPNHWTGRFLSYIINGFRFHVKSIDVEGNTQNSGVFVRAVEDNYVSARDHNPRAALLDYYGVVKDIIELDYHRGRRVVLFDCDWIDGRVRDRYIKTDEYGFVLVNFKHLLPGPDTFTLGSNANQLFYVKDPTQPDWHVAVRTRPRDLFDMGNIMKDDIAAPQNLEPLLVADEDVQKTISQDLELELLFAGMTLSTEPFKGMLMWKVKVLKMVLVL